MSAPDEVTEDYSTGGFTYRAVLTRHEAFGKGKYVDHSMRTIGRVHPEPYKHAAAVTLTQRKLAPPLELGWIINSLIVNSYDSPDA